jgi:hypothetical protein
MIWRMCLFLTSTGNEWSPEGRGSIGDSPRAALLLLEHMNVEYLRKNRKKHFITKSHTIISF